MDRFTPMLRDLRNVLACSLVALVLAACSQDASPTPPAPTAPDLTVSTTLPPATSAPAPTPPAEATPDARHDVSVAPVRPDSLDAEPSEATALDVGKYFIQLYPYMAATGDFAAWRELSDPACKFCESARAGIAARITNGEHTKGGAVLLKSADSREIVPRSSYSVVVDLTEERSQRVSADGSTVAQPDGPNEVRASLVVQWRKGHWRIRGAQFEPQA
jgi:hypothetical protein